MGQATRRRRSRFGGKGPQLLQHLADLQEISLNSLVSTREKRFDRGVVQALVAEVVPIVTREAHRLTAFLRKSVPDTATGGVQKRLERLRKGGRRLARARCWPPMSPGATRRGRSGLKPQEPVDMLYRRRPSVIRRRIDRRCSLRRQTTTSPEPPCRENLRRSVAKALRWRALTAPGCFSSATATSSTVRPPTMRRASTSR